MELLNIEEIRKSFGKKEVLRGFSLKIQEGETIGLIGKSGSGKSVFLNILSGLIAPDKGRIFFKQRNLMRNIKSFRKNIGFVYQENTLFPEMSIKENANYFGKLYGIKKKKIQENVKTLSEILKLNAYLNNRVGTLSGGITRLSNILVSLIHDPEILILDEATVGLDVVTRKMLLWYIKKISQEKKISIIFISHILEEVEYLCDRLCILKDGRIVLDAYVNDLRQRNYNLNNVFESIMENGNA